MKFTKDNKHIKNKLSEVLAKGSMNDLQKFVAENIFELEQSEILYLEDLINGNLEYYR